MSLVAPDGALPTRDRNAGASAVHPLRPILYLVFSLKIVVAALLLGCVALAPPMIADGLYDVAGG